MSATSQTPSLAAQQQSAQLIELPSRLAKPADWLNVDQSNYIALPAESAQADIISFTVPQGYNGIINGVANNYVGGGWIEGSGAVIWQILVDGAPPPGAVSYGSILGSLGSPANPTRIAGFRITENQVVTVVAQNVSITPVSGQLVGARLLGYLYPTSEETDDVMF